MQQTLSQRVTDNLEAHLGCARLLETTLKEEHAALLTGDVTALQRVTDSKAAASEQLERLTGSLEQLRRDAGADTIGALLSRVDDSGRNTARWNDITTLARSCAAANRDNAALLAARQGQIRGTLRALGGGGQDTYGRTGATGNFGPRSLGSA